MAGVSPENRDHINLKSESLRLKYRNDGSGLYWRFEDSFESFQQIELVFDGTSAPHLKVAVKTRRKGLVFREPSVDEVVRFAVLTRHVMPDSDDTKMLKLVARDYLSNEEQRLKEETARIRELKRQI